MIDDSESPSFYDERHYRARKSHKCSDCGRAIEAGETYRVQTGKWDDDISTFKQCAHCEGAGRWLIQRCGGYPVACCREDLGNHWHEEGVREWLLGRLLVSAKRQWRKLDGSLMDVPTIYGVESKPEWMY